MIKLRKKSILKNPPDPKIKRNLFELLVLKLDYYT